jgi:GTP-binding protein
MRYKEKLDILDEAKIFVKGGDGGNGCVSFLRTKYKAKGGPNGGSGGDGGNVILIADLTKDSLLDFTYDVHFKAERGEHGKGGNKDGKTGENLVIKVPVGTVVKDEKGLIIADLYEDGMEMIVANGGRGGRGNKSFASSTLRAPTFAEKGETVEGKWINLELRLIADIGIVGFPNVGKSTLLSKLTSAKPKIANYPFTTLYPKLGVRGEEDFSYIIAEIPGLVEGAHKGAGLGIRFLKHLLRTKIIIHVLEISISSNRDPIEDYKKLKNEMKLFDEQLIEMPQIIALNKVDLLKDDEEIKRVEKFFKEKYKKDVHIISALMSEGLENLSIDIKDQLKKIEERKKKKPEIIKKYIFKEKKRIEIKKEGSAFRVMGNEVERIVKMTDFDNPQAVSYLQKRFDKLKLDEKLLKYGARGGDTILICDMSFEFVPGKSNKKRR